MSAVDDLHPELASLLGTVIHGRYQVDELLGRGGMGAVFKARHLGLERDVAIKVLRPGLSSDDTMGKRFVREAQSVSRLDHPNCVRVTDFGSTDKGIQYLVMELLEGHELEAELGSPWPPARAISMTQQILEALEHAHHFGIVHRDLKPENVFLTTDFRGQPLVKLVDFGIAKLIGEASPNEQLTRKGMVFGTPRYMSPEQASGGKLDERTDLYAVGLLLYEMLAGQPPFVADEVAILLRMQILAPPPALPPAVPAALAGVVGKLLEKTRNKRYASAREAIRALEDARAQLDEAPTVAANAPAQDRTGGTGPAGSHHAPTSALSATGPTVPAPPKPPGPGLPMPPSPGLPMPPTAPAQPLAGSRPASPPAVAPGLPMPPAAPVSPPTLPPLGPGASISGPSASSSAAGFSPASNRPTQGHAPGSGIHEHPPSASIAETHHTPVHTLTPEPAATRERHRPYLPWLIGGVGLLVALMAFGAGQALRSANHSGDASASDDKVGAEGIDPSIANSRFDADCSDGVCGCDKVHACELGCGDHCSVRCTSAARCELELGDHSWAFCNEFGKCEVTCTGDCRVTCPQGGCEVTCPPSYADDDDDDDDDDKGDKHDKKGNKKKKKKKFKTRRDPEASERSPAKTCPDGTLVCGSCD